MKKEQRDLSHWEKASLNESNIERDIARGEGRVYLAGLARGAA